MAKKSSRKTAAKRKPVKRTTRSKSSVKRGAGGRAKSPSPSKGSLDRVATRAPARPKFDDGPRTYFGVPTGSPGGQPVRVSNAKGTRDLPLRLDISNHSPDGFNWGYGGSGPAQLALAILADALGDDRRALKLHQRFKWRTAAEWKDGQPWSITRDEVLAIVESIEEVEGETKGERNRVATERGPVAHEAGLGPGGEPIVWDTNTKGERISKEE